MKVKGRGKEMDAEKLLSIQDLTIECRQGRSVRKIVRDLSLDVNKGEIFGIIGESGCGKTTAVSAIADLLPENFRVSNGKIEYQGRDLAELSPKEYLSYLGNKIGFIFQDPMASLNPLLTVGVQISEKLVLHSKYGKEEIRKKTLETMREVGLADAEAIAGKYPHELSGGMRQRVMIAMATINRPQLIIADEPTTALDPTIQAQILQLLKNIARKYDCSVLIISHNFGVINQICDRVAVMYNGEIVEQADVKTIFKSPLHPYTAGLMQCLPDPGRKGISIVSIPGNMDFNDKLEGCIFYGRCSRKSEVCAGQRCELRQVQEDHYVRCLVSGV